MKRIVIVIVAGLAFGVTAAYATTGHSASSPTRMPHPKAPQTFAVPVDTTTSSSAPASGADDPVTHEQGDDQGQDQQQPTEATTGRDENTQDDNSQDESSQDDTTQDDNSQGDDSQGDQQGGGSQSGDSGSGGD
jgi:hypothetical protein